MSRRGGYDGRRDYDETDIDIDIRRERYPESQAPQRRGETQVRERDTVTNERRTERGPRQPDFLREDYGKSTTAGALVVRERDEDTYSRAPTRRRSQETVRSRAPPERVEKEEIIIRERERDRGGPPYPRSERDFTEIDRKEEFVYRDRARSRGPPPSRRAEEELDIDIKIKHIDSDRPPPPRSDAPSRSEFRERDTEEIRFRRGGGERERQPPPRTEIEREEIRITDTRAVTPRPREREIVREEIDIREERIVPRPRSMSRGALVAKEREEWIVRRRREPSPPPPRDYEKEEIIIRRRERTPSPEPVREPSPEPPPPPMLEPIIRPPIIQEVITHHRHIDHGIERARSETPPPPPPPSPPPVENLEIEIHRKGVRNGKAYDEDIIFEKEISSGRRDDRRRSVSAHTRRRHSPSPSPPRAPQSQLGRQGRRYQDDHDDIAAEAEFYNRKVSARGYPGEAYNGATKDWGLVDVPPGTEKVRLEGVGGGRQEISWERYNGDRRAKFYTGDRMYEDEFGNGGGRMPEAPPPPVREREREREKEVISETRITERRIVEETSRGKTKDKMWTEVTKDLVIKEAIDEMGYEFEETDEFFYVIEYLRYEDVLHLVELTEDIRRQRRDRLREIQWEREQVERQPKMITAPPIPPLPRGPPGAYEERVYERQERREFYDRGDRADRRYR